MDFLNLIVDVKSIEKKWTNGNIGSTVNADEKHFVADKVENVDDCTADNTSINRKRKYDYYAGMLNWIRKVAKDPCDPATNHLPDKSKWKNYGSEQPWKKILLARDAMLLKKNLGASSEQSVWQKKQKMHPSMYNDDQCSPVGSRCSQRLLGKESSLKSHEQLVADSSSSSCLSDDDFTDRQSDAAGESPGFWAKYRRKKRIRIGAPYQGDLPDLCGVDYRSDSKWLGTKIWPLEEGELNRNLIERDPIGKGRQESCGCQFPGSLECVRFHVREKAIKLRLELGPAFYRWKFDSMGEKVAFSWTNTDQNMFQDIVLSNRLSSDKYFWDELFKLFPKKGREVLVSYYFNVFLLRRRAQQNRSTTSDIGSDDEDSEFGPIANKFGQLASKSPGSIFRSPTKSHSTQR
ncbi:AT-rich interactive domain-containing protein 1 [Andrographis paniculata]|uniref:AT-rich interactive domain-containing protein 1 n=1 Tax=Andrographis paniculata TaxID=175694 RepID=UPI0021E8A8FD|nr:AT-rich interactive domain-containing protein 1 [Andrographis paniculata]